ncbi:uncharacterized protein LOC129711738 isoform X2 [Leucoraja erinacea]|uniref:uncharacterized protein LOC129711738 isoform X2 n=1 Tax=Leucoraja erinaceus TaxID=7782 RepID=UPI0024565893|nr:uncharacterized protein LOC129711738 isoform X2 [Leucoraja erinacea]
MLQRTISAALSDAGDGTGQEMLHYCLPHIAHHFSRQLPKRNRAKFQVLLALFVSGFLLPQLSVLARPRSSRYCNQPLLHNLTTYIIFTFLMTGFTFLLTLMDPIPCKLRAAFHTFGVGSFLQGNHHSRALLPVPCAVCTECARYSVHRVPDPIPDDQRFPSWNAFNSRITRWKPPQTGRGLPVLLVHLTKALVNPTHE